MNFPDYLCTIHAGKEGRTPQAATMLGAVTAVEGLLPVVSPVAILSQLVGPDERPHSGAMPTTPVQLLLAPEVHCHATPQLLNRVANLLLQVCAPGFFPSCCIESPACCFLL